MKEYIQCAFLIFITISLINCSSKKNELSEAYIDNKIKVDVVIENKTLDKFYTGKLAGYSVYYGENEKVYMLVKSIDIDTTKLTVDCFGYEYIYDVEIPAKSKIKITMDTIFAINNERYSFNLDKNYGYRETLENNPYNDEQIKFFMYYTNEIMDVEYYSNYVKTINERGHPLYGYYKNGTIYFLIE
jgi:hypothetical protein